MKWTVRSIFFIFLAFLTQCTIEEASHQDPEHLVIVSDYLGVADSSLFDEFASDNDILVKIIHRSADDIIGDFRNKGYATGYDVVMLKSLYDVNRFSKYKFFLDLTKEDEVNRFSSEKYNFVGFGVDPYVIAYNDDSTLFHKNYSDLLSYSYASDLEPSDQIPMLAFIRSTKDKGKTYEWLKKAESNRQNYLTRSTSLLTNYSSYVTLNKRDSSLQHINSVHFPDQSKAGMYYNVRTFAIVDQAERYKQAKSLIAFYTKEANNQRLCNALHIFGIHNNLKLRKESPDGLLQYYSMIERMLNRLS